MITYDQQNRFYNQLLEIVEKMGGRISAHGKLQRGVFLSVIVFHDSTYEKTRDIMCWRLLVSCRMMSITVLMMNTIR